VEAEKNLLVGYSITSLMTSKSEKVQGMPLFVACSLLLARFQQGCSMLITPKTLKMAAKLV
jgi:hypothetical protein